MEFEFSINKFINLVQSITITNSSIMKHTHFLLAGGLLAASSASAMITIDTVSVGDANNGNDTTTGFGGVSYNYYVGTHEVTNSQYVSFLNAVDASGSNPNSIYNASMGSNNRGGISFNSSAASGSMYSTKTNFANKPVNYVSFWDAARFANWLTNGQGSGDTETGMYNLNGITNPANTSVTRQLDFSLGQNGVAISSENEWYKAAYYDGSGNYFDYPTQNNTTPTVATANIVGDIDNPGSNVANYNNGAVWNGSISNVTTVGSAGADSASHYGTFDQGGNVWEWNDAIVNSARGLRGASFVDPGGSLQSSVRSDFGPSNEDSNVGFRVSSLAPIPEPSAYAVILGCLGLGLALVRRKGRA